MDPCFETASRLARAIRNGRLTSRDVTEAHLQRIERLNGSVNALVAVDREGALKMLETSRARDNVHRARFLREVRATRRIAFITPTWSRSSTGAKTPTWCTS